MITETVKKENKMKEVEAKLQDDGKKWRDEHSTKKKNAHIPLRQCARILEKELTFARVVDDIHNRRDRSTAPLFFYDPDNKIYIHDSSYLKDLINKIEDTVDENGANKIIYWLTRDAKFKPRTKAKHLIMVGNGVYNCKDQKLIQSFEPGDKHDFVFTSKVDTDYVEDPVEPVFDNGKWKPSQWINEDICDDDPQKEKLFWQAMYCVVNPNDNKKGCLLLTDDGQGNTGKGTLQQALTNLVGADNRYDLKLHQFQNDFKLASAVNAHLIIGDDNNPGDYIKDSSNLKSIIAGESILYNPKNEAPFSATITAFIIQSMNGMPRFSDTTKANYDRFRALNFNKHYSGKDLNTDVKNKYVNDPRFLEWFLYHALHDVKPFKRLVKTDESNKIIENAQVDSDPIRAFVQEHLDEFNSEKIPTVALFNIFRTVYESENGKKTLISQRSFTRQIKPLMKAKGWQYSKDRINRGWLESDKEYFMKKYDINYLRGNGNGYSYPFTIDSGDRCYFINTENGVKVSDIVTKMDESLLRQ